MSENVKKDDDNTAPPEVDKELSELLESALEDFSKVPSASSNTSNSKNEEKAVSVENGEIKVPEDAEWTEEFIKEAASQFESNLAKLFESNGAQLSAESFQQSLQKMAEAASQVVTNPNQASNNSTISSSISQTIQDLSQGAENLRNPFSEQDLMNMFAGQNVDENAFLPFMQGMMESLLSKDVLYPSLKDLLEKYPEWLSANGSNLPKEELEKYEKQQEIMKQVCAELETENEADSNDQKKLRFEKVLTLMQKLQDYGQPPKELIGDVPLDFPNLNQQMGPDQCAQM